MTTINFGMIGLGRMGANIVRRLARHNISSVVFDLNQKAVAELSGEGSTGASGIADFVSKLPAPRTVWVMVPAQVTDLTIAEIAEHLAPGDTVIDGGNSYYKNDVKNDLKGIKLRVPEGKWRVKMFQAYGANPTPMAFGDVFVALKTGTIDGQENPYTQITSAKFHEVQKFLSVTNHVYTPAFVVVHKDAWNKLPEDVRKIIEQAAKDTQPFVYKRAAEMEVSLLKVVKDAGVKVNTANRDAFVKASDPIYKEFATDVKSGSTLVSKILDLAKTK